MPRGPHHYGSKGACIYRGVRDELLTDEHIVPYSLGGSHVIRRASCLGCADMTKKFEQKVDRPVGRCSHSLQRADKAETRAQEPHNGYRSR